jgi:hypothetical protein
LVLSSQFAFEVRFRFSVFGLKVRVANQIANKPGTEHPNVNFEVRTELEHEPRTEHPEA